MTYSFNKWVIHLQKEMGLIFVWHSLSQILILILHHCINLDTFHSKVCYSNTWQCVIFNLMGQWKNRIGRCMDLSCPNHWSILSFPWLCTAKSYQIYNLMVWHSSNCCVLANSTETLASNRFEIEETILPVGLTSQIVSRLCCFGCSDETRWLPSVREGDAVHWKSM